MTTDTATQEITNEYTGTHPFNKMRSEIKWALKKAQELGYITPDDSLVKLAAPLLSELDKRVPSKAPATCPRCGKASTRLLDMLNKDGKPVRIHPTCLQAGDHKA